MVEAVGVEPTSGKRVSEASTCVAFYLKSRRARVGRRHLARQPALLYIRVRHKATGPLDPLWRRTDERRGSRSHRYVAAI